MACCIASGASPPSGICSINCDTMPVSEAKSVTGTTSGTGDDQLTIALITDHSWRTEEMAVQLLRWRYSILWLRPFDLAVSGALMQRAALILTTRSRWQIERIPGQAHPPVVTTDDFDLRLKTRIEACLKSRGLVPPA